ncbi:hypothetical protein LCGC14_0610500 [marine sediment metagenome]|uniref:Uncharacterized protein n=1 Tax=marine sediment metagenome TaxID=412755 RepID=A0A0F9TU53_9ZZZZ
MKIYLTSKELKEIINCIDAAKREDLAYGMVPANVEQCAVNNRTKLLNKLNKIYDTIRKD